jgi:hypothetical protein
MKTQAFTRDPFRISFKIGVLVFAIISAAAVTTFAQRGAGSIGGIVKDSQNAYVSGASVTVTNIDTGVEIKLKTNKKGFYKVLGLLPGYYTLAVDAKDFVTKAIQNIRVGVGEVRMDVKLELHSKDDL